MANEALIPPPSIGESKTPGTKRMVPVTEKRKRGFKLWLIVLSCVVAGVSLGVIVYQRSITPPTRPSPTPRPAVTPRPSPSPAVPRVSQVTPQGNTINFPKAGEVRAYFGSFTGTPTILLDMEGKSGSAGVSMTGNGSMTTMVYMDTGLVLSGAEEVTVKAYDNADYSKPAYGWIPPDASNRCGGSGTQAKPDITPYIDWATQQAGGEPLVSIQCWGDWGPAGDPGNADFNDYVVILSYAPAGSNPSPSASVSPSSTPSSTPSPTPSPSAGLAGTPTPSPSPRAALPDASALPDAGVFEVTVGTMSVGVLFLVLGLLGLLLR